MSALRGPLACLVVCAALVVPFAACGTQEAPGPESAAPRIEAVPAARRWIEFSQDLVRASGPAPTTAARIYAYVATAYGDVREIASEGEASAAAREIAMLLFPDKKSEVAAFAASLPQANLSAPAAAITEALRSRLDTDSYRSANEPAPRIEGDGYWVGRDPLTPGAGNWERWVVGGASFSVAPPPEFGSEAYAKDLQAVRHAVLRRDARWVEIINFWGGVPGTETPAGIWLNRLWDESRELGLGDGEFARIQRVLAQTLADAFIECWRVKYTYWTARPDMVDGGIATAMPNPPFPGYVSGHSTVSAAGATVLGRLLPDKAELFINDAREARDSRLYAGIHFPVDNEAGFRLGEDVGRMVIQRLGL